MRLGLPTTQVSLAAIDENQHRELEPPKAAFQAMIISGSDARGVGLANEIQFRVESEEGVPSAAQSAKVNFTDIVTVQSMDDDDFRIKLPPELEFLAHPPCESAATSKRFKTRQGGETKVVSTASRNVDSTRRLVAGLVYSTLFQTFVVLIILTDLSLTVLTMRNVVTEESQFFDIAAWIIACTLAIDCFARFYAERLPFLYSKMNIFELFLVPLTFLEILVFSNMNVPLPILRALRPIFRGLRILRVLVRSAGKTNGYVQRLRRLVSGDRLRFSQDGFDLDLAYINPQIITMALPGTGREILFRNPSWEVARFLNERHFGKYLVVNTTQTQRYHTDAFFERIYRYPISINSVPNLDSLHRLCQVLDEYLKISPEHVVAIHSKHGQGRVCLVAAALLIFRDDTVTVSAVLGKLERSRADPESRQIGFGAQSSDCASQRRYLEYFRKLCHSPNGRKAMSRSAKLTKAQLFAVNSASTIDIAAFTHNGARPGRDGTLVPPDQPSAAARSLFSMKRLHTLDLKKVGRSSSGILDNGETLTEASTTKGLDAEGICTHDRSLLLAGHSLFQASRRFMEEATNDSSPSGSRPLSHTPIFHSNPELGFDEGIAVTVHPEDQLAPAVWLINRDPMTGEFRLEVHKRRPHHDHLPRRRRWWCCCCRRRTADTGTRFKEGLLFSCWLHTGFLEEEEPLDFRPEAVGVAAARRVVVVLDRFGIDKAFGAPPLRSYSMMFKVQLEFDVDERLDLSHAESRLQQLRLPAGLDASPSCDLSWLTWVSQRLWPVFRQALEKLIGDEILPDAIKALPAPFKSIRIAECSFGDGCPKFESITASSRSSDGLEIQLDIVMDYSTETRIVLDAGLANFSIVGLRLAGQLSVSFRPILPELPVLSALRLFFLNPPELDVKFGASLEVVESFQLVKNAISGSIHSVVHDILVLPNVLCVNWADPTNHKTCSFVDTPPVAVVRVTIHRAVELQPACNILMAPSTSCRVAVGLSPGLLTSSITDTMAPAWEETFEFVIYDERQRVSVSVQDSGFGGRAILLGRNEVELMELVAADVDGLWLPMLDKNGQRACQVSLSATLLVPILGTHMLEQYLSEATTLHGSSPGEMITSALTAGVNFVSGGANNLPWSRRVAPTREQTRKDMSAIAEEEDVKPEGHLSNAVALLLFEVFGGFLPAALGAAAGLEIQVRIGSRSCRRWASPADAIDSSVVDERTVKAIQRLSAHGLKVDAIADALGATVQDVQHVVASAHWNFEVPKKLVLLLRPEDLTGKPPVFIAALLKGKPVAAGRLPLDRLLRNGTPRFRDVVLLGAAGIDDVVSLELEVKTFGLIERDPPAGDDLLGSEQTTIRI